MPQTPLTGSGKQVVRFDQGANQRYSPGVGTPSQGSFKNQLEDSLESSGFRFTRQREGVFEVVAESHDHPTADEILERARRKMPEISFATVYNCLSVLVRCGLVRQVTLNRGSTRFCPNMREHGHFFCEACGRVMDIDFPAGSALNTMRGMPAPRGFKVTSFDLSLRGVCPDCQGAPRKRLKPRE